MISELSTEGKLVFINSGDNNCRNLEYLVLVNFAWIKFPQLFRNDEDRLTTTIILNLKNIPFQNKFFTMTFSQIEHPFSIYVNTLSTFVI
jgi:hypothetical protein